MEIENINNIVDENYDVLMEEVNSILNDIWSDLYADKDYFKIELTSSDGTPTVLECERINKQH